MKNKHKEKLFNDVNREYANNKFISKNMCYFLYIIYLISYI